MRNGELHALQRLSLLDLERLAAELPIALARVQAQAALCAEEQRLRQAAGGECVVCMEAVSEARYAFVPCGHQCCCRDCGQKIMATRRTCPLCNATCQLHMRVHAT